MKPDKATAYTEFTDNLTQKCYFRVLLQYYEELKKRGREGDLPGYRSLVGRHCRAARKCLGQHPGWSSSKDRLVFLPVSGWPDASA